MEENWWSVSRKLLFVIPLAITSYNQYVKHNLIFKILSNAYSKHGRNKSIESRVLVKFDNTGRNHSNQMHSKLLEATTKQKTIHVIKASYQKCTLFYDIVNM